MRMILACAAALALTVSGARADEKDEKDEKETVRAVYEAVDAQPVTVPTESTVRLRVKGSHNRPPRTN